MTPTSSPSLDEADAPGFTGPFTQTSGYGHDFAGTTLDVDGLVQVSVREESMLDLWSNEVLNLSFGEHHGTPDMKLTRHDKALLLEHAGRHGSNRRSSPNRRLDHHPRRLRSATATTLVDCAVGVTANERPRVLYADGDDLKMGRYAEQSQTYYDGPRWHTRTIMEDVARRTSLLTSRPTAWSGA